MNNIDLVLTRQEQFNLEEAMLQHCEGTWANSMARLLRVSDPNNKARLMAAFPELVDRFGPGSRASMVNVARQHAQFLVTKTYD